MEAVQIIRPERPASTDIAQRVAGDVAIV